MTVIRRRKDELKHPYISVDRKKSSMKSISGNDLYYWVAILRLSKSMKIILQNKRGRKVFYGKKGALRLAMWHSEAICRIGTPVPIYVFRSPGKLIEKWEFMHSIQCWAEYYKIKEKFPRLTETHV